MVVHKMHGFELENAIRLGKPVHHERIVKLVVSTRVAPAWLLEHGYAFRWTLETALAAWAMETGAPSARRAPIDRG